MSGESVPYHLRQNKHVDRQLFAELLAHVNRVSPIAKALYVSFGGVYFEDFKLIHQVFGTKKMLSIEREDWVVKRQRHNRPYGCIRCKHMTSRQLVNSIDAIRRRNSGQLICWLDFADASGRRGQLEDVGILTKSARHLDVLRVTMNVNSESLGPQIPKETVEDRDKRRYEHLVEKYSDKISRKVEVQDASQEKFPIFCLEMIKQEILRAVTSSPDLVFLPIGIFTYADSEHTMLTVTGVFLKTTKVNSFISQTCLRDFAFACLDWELIHINVPLLSQREKLTLDQRFGSGRTAASVAASLAFRVNKKPEISEDMLKSYFNFHRYYPHFHRIQY
jgi:hypothetical protein